jgi:hypothetical protein
MKLLQIILFLFPFSLMAQSYLGKAPKVIESRAANCAPPTATTFLQTNNVKAMVHTAGNLWQVPGQNYSQYEVPKNSGIMALFTAALWLGGTDINGQLKLAALRYRNGQDYWTGPISQGAAITDYATCQKYDKHFTTTQDMVREFDAWYESGLYDLENGTNTQSENFPNYTIPKIIKEWPAHGDVSLGQDYYLAPFYDRDNDGNYNWENGDFPWYDIKKDKVCSVDRKVSLYGDENFWWIMNDKGNIHTETGADPIGMEIRAQAFAFATNDEINNMTFYNYELINRGTQTLYNTYFGFFADAALGDPFDDYVGCDVNRGLAYVYNGDSYDGDNSGFKGYGVNPPSVGVDFFEGPYQDNDNIDNAFGIGLNEALNGIGYGDGIIDNERFGMRRFLYYVNAGGGGNPNQTDPITGSDFYNYLRGFWKDGTPFYYGGSGYIADQEADPTVPCDFMFPGDTDPLGWGTSGNPQIPWTEETAGNQPYDRRFVQSAGPFVLKPGAINNITVGVVWARANSGGPFASVEVLRRADDKAQALFENCFKVLDGPYAPDLKIQELENELILTLSNPINSNNAKEDYKEFDPFISAADSTADKFYHFQGYMIYQVTSSSVSASQIEDVSKARLVAQCDIKDNVSTLINFEYDEELEVAIPVKKVQGANTGIKHSFSVNEDLFAQGNRTLVNFKRYYYLAVSYAYNNYKNYDPSDPQQLDGQKKPFLASRKATIGEIKTIEAIPHNPIPEAGGTIQSLFYGSTPQITRLDGTGNGNNSLEFTESTLTKIITEGFVPKPTYDYGSGPLNVKVVDPLNVVGGYFECRFRNYQNVGAEQHINYYGTDTASWVIYRYDSENKVNLLDSVVSERTIKNQNEQIIAKWGISVEIIQNKYFKATDPNGSDIAQSLEYDRYTLPIESTVEFKDSSKRWLSFIYDNDNYYPTNWILSGVYNPIGADTVTQTPAYLSPKFYKDELGKDPDQNYEKILSGGFAPHNLTGYRNEFSPLCYPTGTGFLSAGTITTMRARSSISRLPSINIVITSDKSKWTRCAVIELGRNEALNIGQAKAGGLRKSQSVDINGNPTAGYGMSWFPGYAIDLETGMRLHMAFGENSFLGSDNGSDMIWNPSDRVVDNNGRPIMAGQHPIYVFGYNINGEGCPFYDGSNWVYDQFFENTSASLKSVYTSLSWVGNPILAEGQKHLSTDVKIRIRVNKEYNEFTATGENGGKPMYSWNMDGIRTVTGSQDQLAETLKLINVVPNPYYAYSQYEKSRLDARVKITNLPEICAIKIYNVSGKLVKTIKKANTNTYEDWNLKNDVGIPIASGVYLIHVNVPDVGDVIVKAFIAMRTSDLENI